MSNLYRYASELFWGYCEKFMKGEFDIKNLYDGIITHNLRSANYYKDKAEVKARYASYASRNSYKIRFSNVITLERNFIAEDIKFRLNAVELSKAMFELRCVGNVVNDGETFHKPNTADEDAYEALRDDFMPKLYLAYAKVHDALYSAQKAFNNGYDDTLREACDATFREACKIFKEACNDLNDLREKVDLSSVFAKKSSRPIHNKLIPRADATANAAVMCAIVFIHFKNAYADLNSLKIATDAYNAAQQQSKEAIAELPSDFAGTWEMFTVK